MSSRDKILEGLHVTIKEHLVELRELFGFEFEPEVNALSLEACQRYAEKLNNLLSSLKEMRERDPERFWEVMGICKKLRDVTLIDMFLKAVD